MSQKSSRPFSFWLSFSACLFLGLSFCFLPSQSELVAQAAALPSPLQSREVLLPAAYPLKSSDSFPPEITARAAVVLDRPSGVFLFQKESDLPLLPASTTKIMTALVALDHYGLGDVLRVSQPSGDGQTIDLEEGELITVDALLYALLVSSANDAAEALARNYPGGEAGFVAAMNLKAKDLHLTSTSYANPSGLDNSDEEIPVRAESVTSAADLARLADYALKNKEFARRVRTKEIFLQGRPTGQPLYNLNQLLWQDGVKGIKTGWTPKAGECLVTAVERNGHDLILVILGSENRFGETEKLMTWIFANFRWQDF